ncbi:MAG: tetratricopeptide repeat protein [Bacteroidales bacterium]|nr:tetratricopeptide repeat protein [Bacteroidales bacterium]
MKRNYFILLFLLSLFLLNACSTKKDKWMNKKYHNLLAKYNGYFNGYESLKEGVLELERGHVDNYDDILPVYRLGSVQQAQGQFPKMDRAIEKAVKMIRKHSMTFKGVEHVKWVQKSYLMIGEANFYKREYELASESFDFVIRLYNYSPIKYEAYLRSAITNNITGNYGKSEAMLELLENAIEEGKLNGRQIHEFHKTSADYYIRTGDFENAAKSLTDALKTTRKKKTKVRLNYILGQVFMRSGNLAEASKAFNKVIRMSSPYDMEFNVKISAAMCYDAASGDSKNLIELLTKMLRDDKNKDYLDQIYFALAQIAIKDQEVDQAIEYLKLSTQKSVSNDRQKAISFHTIAELYFEKADYLNAGIFYDSTMAFLPTDYREYRQIEAKHKVLSELVKNLQIVILEDSLQKLAGMSERERMAIVDGIIEEIVADERRMQEEENERMQSLALHGQNQMGMQQQNSDGKWYFYNPQAVSFGFSEFRRKWGERRLEDMWRLSNKEMVMDFNDGFTENQLSDSTGGTASGGPTDPKDKNTYLKNIPTTPEMLEKSHTRIIDAIYAIATIYKEGLRELNLSNESFEELLRRYPDSKYTLNTYYHLYRNYAQLNNVPKSDYYKNLILNNFSDSEHAKLINDPEYMQKMAQTQNEAEVYYSEVYNDYVANNYNSAIMKADMGISRFAGSSTEAKFAYIKTLCIGKTQSKEVFTQSLNDFMTKYGNSDLAPLAKNILDYLGNSSTDSTQTTTTRTGDIYTKNLETIHFFVMIVDAQKINVNQLKIKLSNFNSEFHRLKNLTISNVFLDNVKQIITIANFDNASNAINYHSSVLNNRELFSDYSAADYTTFVISVDNYPVFYRDKDVQKYMTFFNANYPQ